MGKQIEPQYEAGMLSHYVGKYFTLVASSLHNGKPDRARERGSELVSVLKKLEPQTILIKAVTSSAEKVDWTDADSFGRFKEEYQRLKDDAKRDVESGSL